MDSVTDMFDRVERSHILQALQHLDAVGPTEIDDSDDCDLVFRSRWYSARRVAAMALDLMNASNLRIHAFKDIEKSAIFLLTASELELHQKNHGKTALVLVHSIHLERGESGLVGTGGGVELHAPWSLDGWEFEATAFRARRTDDAFRSLR